MVDRLDPMIGESGEIIERTPEETRAAFEETLGPRRDRVKGIGRKPPKVRSTYEQGESSQSQPPTVLTQQQVTSKSYIYQSNMLGKQIDNMLLVLMVNWLNRKANC